MLLNKIKKQNTHTHTHTHTTSTHSLLVPRTEHQYLNESTDVAAIFETGCPVCWGYWHFSLYGKILPLWSHWYTQKVHDNILTKQPSIKQL